MRCPLAEEKTVSRRVFIYNVKPYSIFYPPANWGKKIELKLEKTWLEVGEA